MTSVRMNGAQAPSGQGVLAGALENLNVLVSTEALVGLGVALLWMLGHGYVGIAEDARIYMGRAVADLDPTGVGRDLMFRLDGQSSFTIFRLMARTLVGWIGLGAATATLSLLGLSVWFVAIVALAWTLAPGRALALVLAVAFVLPRSYAPFDIFAAGEATAIPRPLAEAGVLLALTALHHRRTLICLACLVIAAAFHPIMATPGFGVLAIVLARDDRRWLIGLGVLLALSAAAALLGLPFVSRLTMTIDPAWRDALAERNFYLFVHLWPPTSVVSPLIIWGVTLALACTWLDSRARTILVAAFLVGMLGLAAALVLGDGLDSLLVVQAQLWRALWLTASIAPLAAGACLWRLPEHGASGQIALAFLSLAWIGFTWFPIGPLAALIALAAFVGGPRLSFPIGRPVVLAAWLVGATLASVILSLPASTLMALVATRPIGATIPWSIIWSTGLLCVPIVLLAGAWWRWPERGATRIGALLFAGVAMLLCVTSWDTRSALQKDVDGGVRKPDLAAILNTRPGEILWTEGDEGWFWLGRPNWNSIVQGSAGVFSRALALEWHERARAVVTAGLARGDRLRPWGAPKTLAPPTLDPAKLHAFCAKPDAPAWIVTPIAPSDALPPNLDGRTWTSPAAQTDILATETNLLWRTSKRYAIVPCARLP